MPLESNNANVGNRVTAIRVSTRLTHATVLSGIRVDTVSRSSTNAVPSRLRNSSLSTNVAEGAAAVSGSLPATGRANSSRMSLCSALATALAARRSSSHLGRAGESVRLGEAGVSEAVLGGAGGRCGLSTKSKTTAPIAQNANRPRPRRIGARVLMPESFAVHGGDSEVAVQHGETDTLGIPTVDNANLVPLRPIVDAPRCIVCRLKCLGSGTSLPDRGRAEFIVGRSATTVGRIRWEGFGAKGAFFSGKGASECGECSGRAATRESPDAAFRPA